MTGNNYDRVAFCYDALSRVIFGNTLTRSQTCLLPFLRDNDHILIAGGGTGKILEAIDRLGKKRLKILYADASLKMVRHARKRKLSNIEVEFVVSSVENLPFTGNFDIVLTPFLFDNFTEETASEVFASLHKQLLRGGYWLFVDFNMDNNAAGWKKALLKIMYHFFRATAGITANRLPDTDTLFRGHNYRLVFETWHYRRFVHSCVWQKPLILR